MGLKSKFIVLLSKYRALLPFIEAQAKLETGNFTSKVYLKDNNMFGMKLPVKRPTVATKGLPSPGSEANGGAPNYYAHYLSDADSLRDLFLWMDYVNFPTTVKDSNQYAVELKNRSYYGADLVSYQKNLDYWLKG